MDLEGRLGFWCVAQRKLLCRYLFVPRFRKGCKHAVVVAFAGQQTAWGKGNGVMVTMGSYLCLLKGLQYCLIAALLVERILVIEV